MTILRSTRALYGAFLEKFGPKKFFEKKLKFLLLIEFSCNRYDFFTQDTYNKSKKRNGAGIWNFSVFVVIWGRVGSEFDQKKGF